MDNIELMDQLIIGRVEPHIYAFSTNTIPDYIKVGDTYRSLIDRLNEWRRHFPDLRQEFEVKASISPDVFFRDYSVHDYLENDLGKQRLLIEDMDGYPPGTYYSKEFFKDITKEDVQKAILDIKRSYTKKENKYRFYNARTFLPQTYTYASTGNWTPRPNQQEAIDNFVHAVKAGRTNLLMYAVMRFGKSFTSLCCAKEIGARTVLVVSAKAEVREEWKKTVQSADNFNKDYMFLASEELSRNSSAIRNVLKDGRGVVIFLTLQDLQGDELKEKHKELFKTKLDILIIDETHYGARASSYGQIIRTAGYAKDIKLKFDSDEGDDFIETNEADAVIKTLDVHVKLHLSGTPYRILMGSEFSKEDIVSFCQFSDIVSEQKKWDDEKLLEDGVEEWKNPYYGFPQMLRFAFVPSKSALALLESLRKNGTTYALSELLKPRSISKKKDESHKIFIHEKEVFELLEAIDGSKSDDNIFAFLDYDKIQEGKMCRHMVCVLPYCASCDALEKLLTDKAAAFKNLGSYEIINISGVDSIHIYKTVQSIKDKIQRCEIQEKKTITLTVNRMLTGSTVEYWDTMLFLKDTASPQEYDQAVFRLQNQYIKSYVDKDGKEIRYNMKPQTLLVDFDPHRMFMMQEQKSLIYNVNTDSFGNKHLKERMAEELRISPIITFNKGKIKQVEAGDLLEFISKYSATRGVKEEAKEIPVDVNLFHIEAIKTEIERQSQLGTKGGLKTQVYQGDEQDLDNPDDDQDAKSVSGEEKRILDSPDLRNEDSFQIQILQNKFKTYYSRILFFAFLSEDQVESLAEILLCAYTEDNARIIRNLDLDIDVLSQIQENMNPFILSTLDYKIQNINRLSKDENIPSIERAITAVGKFGKISESEITTPVNVTSEMISLLSDDCFVTLSDPSNKILDISSKMGEFAIAICRRCEQMGIDISTISDSVEAIPTSRITYEFTRKVYKILGLDVNAIAAEFTSYDLYPMEYNKVSRLLKQNKRMCNIKMDDLAVRTKGDEWMNFNAVVGNPPYQEEADTSSKTNGQKPRKNIFQHFVRQAEILSESNVVMIFPGLRWLHQSGKGLKDFGRNLINSERLNKLIFYPNSKDVFDGIDIPDGISVVHLGENRKDKVFEYEYIGEDLHTRMDRKKPGSELFVVNPRDIEIISKIQSFVKKNNLHYLHDAVLPRSLFGIESDFIEKYKGGCELHDGTSTIDYEKSIKILTNDKSGPAGRSKWFVVDKCAVKQNEKYISEWQVVVSSAHPGGQEGRDNQIEIIDNHSAFGRARVALRSFQTRAEASNFVSYVNSRFIRFAFLMSDESLTSLAKFVPDIGDYRQDNGFIDFSKDIDEQFKTLLNLSEDEEKYINLNIKIKKE